MAARVVQWIFAAFLLAVGAYLAVRGSQLIGLGGSWYYAIAGVALVAVAVLLVLRNAWGPRLYALIVAATVVWSIFEAGLDLLALLPRLAAWIGVGLWFLTPWHRAAMRASPDQAPQSGALWVGGSIAAGALLLVAGALQPYHKEQFDLPDSSGAPTTVTDWRHYGNSSGGTRFAQLQQITPENVSQLQEVWRYRTGVPYDFKMTPLQVGDLLYVCTAGNILIALDPVTGDQRWRHDTRSQVPGARGGDIANASTFARTCRGVGYHEGAADSLGMCAKRIVTGTTDARLIAVDALSGNRCTEFGFGGEVNLKSGLGPHPPGEYMVTSTPLIAGDVVVVGGWVSDNQQLGNVSGVIRGYDVVTGNFVWAWDMGNPGYQGLPEEGGEFTRGTPNVWSNMSYDPELNLIYAPTGNSSPDYYGPKRREFDEAYSAATIAVDAATGELRWAYQNTHHDIWDYDAPSQPVLVTITKDGQSIPAVAQPTKRGEIFLLDRRDGTPIWPATTCPDGSTALAGGECPVPQGAADGDFVTATQPFSGLPTFRPDRWEKDMWGLTPLDQLFCRIEYKKMRYDGHFTPPMRGGGDNDILPTHGGSFQYPGNAGGFNWPSVSVDADNGLLIAQPMLMGNRIYMASVEELAETRRLRAERAARRNPQTDEHAGPTPPPQAAPPQQGAQGGQRPQGAPGGGMQRPPYTAQGEWEPGAPRMGMTSPFMSTWSIPFTDIATNIPCFEPPYGRLAVIDLNQNRLLWSRPIGTIEEMGPFGLGLGLPINVGTPIYGGTMTTRSGLIFQVGTMDSRIRAVDIKTGKVRWTTKMPGTANGTPITYQGADGRQYVVIVVPNPGFVYPRDGDAEPSDDQGGYVIAYALPEGAQQ